MDKTKISSPADGSLYFNIQADFGFTKHPGGLKATWELLNSCKVNKDSHILVIGCGVGITPCFIVEEIGCKVTGIDLSSGMIEKAIVRAKNKGLENRLSFRTADAQELPFEDNSFDVVICESMNAFIPDKTRAMKEYVRVIKPGGFVGINEVHWVKEPTDDLRKYAELIMAGANFLSVEGWRNLIVEAGLLEVQASCYKMDMRQQRIEEMRGMGKEESLQAWKRFIKGLFTEPAYWRFTKQVLSQPGMIFQFMKHIGYGIYVGKK